MKFKELIYLADKVADKIKRYVAIDVDYHNYRSGIKQLRYGFYEESYSKGTVYFKSALGLKSHMENILKEMQF